MSAFTSTELAAMQTTQEAYMMDAGKVITITTGSADAYGLPAKTETASAEIACGFWFANKTKEGQDETEVVLIDAYVRLPRATTIAAGDRFELTKRFGTAISPTIQFEVIGQPKMGPSGLVVELKKATLL